MGQTKRTTKRAPAKPKTAMGRRDVERKLRSGPAPVKVDLPVGPDIGRLVHEGIAAHMHAENLAEISKRGLARGGSQGLWVDGVSYGECPRKAHARMLGGVAPLTPEEMLKRRRKQWMFDSGNANEDAWYRNLKLSSWRGPILREEDIPLLWSIAKHEGDGEIPGSGREDLILCYADDEPGGVPIQAADGRIVRPALALELKQISSVGIAVDVLFEDGKPELKHATQLSRYMVVLQCPGQLWYTNPFVIPVPNWSFVQPYIPRPGEAGAEFVDFSKSGEASKIQPAEYGYHLAWLDGVLYFARYGRESEGWIRTIVTRDGLDDFWVAVDDQPLAGLASRPRSFDLYGEPKYYSPCNYCDMQRTCDAHEHNYEEWRDAVVATRIETSEEK